MLKSDNYDGNSIICMILYLILYSCNSVFTYINAYSIWMYHVYKKLGDSKSISE
jgi:hypothetical protein